MDTAITPQQATGLLEANRLREARQAFQSICRRDRGDMTSLLALGVVCQRLRDLPAAETCFRKVGKLQPTNVQALYELGVTLQLQGRHADAVPVYRRCLELQPDFLEACINLAAAYGSSGELDHAVDTFQRGVAIRPGDPMVYYRLAAASEKLHRFEDARQALEGGLALAPDHVGMNVIMAQLERREGKLDTARARLERLQQTPCSGIDAAGLYTELGKVCDRQQDYSRAFQAFEQAHSAAAETPEAAAARAVPYLETVREYHAFFSAERVLAWPPAAGPKPVFLVGHPRSGTTLTENILAAHPLLAPSDESPFLRRTIDAMASILGRPVSYPECLDTLSDNDVERLRRHYLNQCEEFPAAVGKRLIDKYPLNLVDLGFVRRVFPEARILVALRDPRDVCLSCFSQIFSLNKATVHFTTLDGTAAHYAEVMGLWLYYRETLGLRFMEFRYEDLVDDLEGTAKRLLTFLDEPWDEAVMAFHDQASRRYISTPSYEGVTRRIYKHSVGHWRNYEKHLAPILPALQPFVDAFGYASGGSARGS